jgi:molybdopterin-guanine dinucleotide biosynthesis protein A
VRSYDDDTDMSVALVLAGGRGSRLGGRKAAVTLNGRPLIAHVLAAARDGGLEPIVVAKVDTELPPLDCRIVHEPDLPRHPLCGIVAGLAAVAAPAAVVCPTDMPFVAGPLLAWLGSLAQPLVVVRAGGRVEPLLGRYATGLVPELAALLPQEPAMTEVVASLGARIVEEAELRRFGDPDRMLINVNTPAGLARARRVR